jgi:peptidoglycan/LPS O-acetylase OafA/YrhL
VTHLFYLLYLALCVGLSLLSFRYFETPARLWLLARFDMRRQRNIAGTHATQQAALPFLP